MTAHSTGLTSALEREPAVPSMPAASVTSHGQMGMAHGDGFPIVFPSQPHRPAWSGEILWQEEGTAATPLVSAHLKEDTGSARQSNECTAGERGAVQTKPI